MSGDVDMTVIWHEVECGPYSADLPLWEELAERADGAILDLGCGTGRVASHLARRGHQVLGLDLDPKLVDALEQGRQGDVRDFALGREFALILAPMQLIQMVGGRADRVACLRCVAAHLADDGVAAFAIVDGVPSSANAAPPLPDTLERDGWVYSSQPIETLVNSELIRARRLRQTVSPAGALDEQVSEDVLSTLTSPQLEREASEASLRSAGRRAVPSTEDHVGSTVVLLEKEA